MIVSVNLTTRELIDLAGKLESAVAKFDKALEAVKAEIDAQRKAVEEAEAHVDSAVADFEAGSPAPEAAPAEPVVAEQPVVAAPPVPFS